MIVIVMHNNRDYLEYLAKLATREGVNDFKVINRKGIGILLDGGDASVVLTRGSRVEA